MNRVLLTKEECPCGGGVRLAGRRAEHILRVLNAAPGQTIRIGVLNGPTGRGAVIAAEGGSLLLRCELDPEPPPRCRVDLLLALPRPKVMRRLWAVLASLGVGRLILTHAAKVERNYFDTHWLNREYYEPLLVEGLEQSGDTWMPEVTICRRFRPCIEDELDSLLPNSRRVVAHPEAKEGMGRVAVGAEQRLLLAVGPEGGWTAYELDLLTRHGFTPASMGWRRLRSDTACAALLALAHARVEREGESA